MKNILTRDIAKLCIVLILSSITVITQAQERKGCGDECSKSKARNKIAMNEKESKPIVCKLTSKELQERKANVIALLKKEVIERKELPDGYSYKFKGDDRSIDNLVSFVKTERQCCGFFTFNISITEDFAFLELTGPDGAKDFVDSEIGL